jgi:hypothetical protein
MALARALVSFGSHTLRSVGAAFSLARESRSCCDCSVSSVRQLSTATDSGRQESGPASTSFSSIPTFEQADEASIKIADSSDVEERFYAPSSSDRHLEPLSGAQRRILRARAEQLARLDDLQYIRIGKHQITHRFLHNCVELLDRHEIVRVQPAGCCGPSLPRGY